MRMDRNAVKRERQPEWYEAFTCSRCAKIKPVTDRFTRIADGSPILGFCPVKGFCVLLDGKAEKCFEK